MKEYLKLLSHTQPVERGIKDLTEISKKYSPEKRDAVMLVREKHRKIMPRFTTKKDFKWLEGIFI